MAPAMGMVRGAGIQQKNFLKDPISLPRTRGVFAALGWKVRDKLEGPWICITLTGHISTVRFIVQAVVRMGRESMTTTAGQFLGAFFCRLSGLSKLSCADIPDHVPTRLKVRRFRGILTLSAFPANLRNPLVDTILLSRFSDFSFMSQGEVMGGFLPCCRTPL